MKHGRLILGVLFWLLLAANGVAQRVEMLCTQVDDFGEILVSWSATAIPADYQYQLYASNSINGPYNDSILTGATFHLHTGADGRNKQWFYYVKAEPIPPKTGQTYTSDTLGSILLTLYNSGNGVAQLYWNRPAIPPLPTQDSEFVILRGEGGILQQLTQCDTTRYLDTLHVCGKTMDFQISLRDSRGCENISTVQSYYFWDFIQPAEPQLDSVSINPNTGNTELGWNRSSSSDVFGYIIYIHIYENGRWKWQPIDTVFGAENTHYIDLQNDANGNTQEYCIAAIDTCFNASPMVDEHNTMLPNVSYTDKDMCDSMLNISWNAYKNMPDGLTGYRIWVSENGGSFFIADTVPPNQLSYRHKGINTFHKFTYYIQAYNSDNGYTASSAKVDVNFNRTANSGDVWLRYVSVVDNKDIEVAVFVSDTVRYNSLFLFRSSNNGIYFSKIDEQRKSNGVENYTFIDANADVQTETYLYTVHLTDVCDEPFAQSDTANNIVLKAVDAPADMNEIKWTAYDGFGNRLDGYDVYRQLQTDAGFQLIDNLSAFQTDFAENAGSMASQGGKFLYQVAATEDQTNPHGFSDQSFSNVVELAKSPLSFIPNAFRPSSEIEVNRIFKPVLTYVDAKEYVFSIFDRWGNLIFYTTDITAGWDGTIDGKPAAIGVYQYALTYRLNATKIYKTQGHVNLIR